MVEANGNEEVAQRVQGEDSDSEAEDEEPENLQCCSYSVILQNCSLPSLSSHYLLLLEPAPLG